MNEKIIKHFSQWWRVRLEKHNAPVRIFRWLHHPWRTGKEGSSPRRANLSRIFQSNAFDGQEVLWLFSRSSEENVILELLVSSYYKPYTRAHEVCKGIMIELKHVAYHIQYPTSVGGARQWTPVVTKDWFSSSTKSHGEIYPGMWYLGLGFPWFVSGKGFTFFFVFIDSSHYRRLPSVCNPSVICHWLSFLQLRRTLLSPHL